MTTPPDHEAEDRELIFRIKEWARENLVGHHGFAMNSDDDLWHLITTARHADREEIERLKERVKELSSESFHPLHDADILNQPASTLANYRIGDKRSRTLYVSQRLLHVVLLAYLKHWKGNDDVIGWDALGDELHSAICEAVGDDEFCKWNDTTSQV